MTLQRVCFQLTRQYVSKLSLLQSNKQTYCKLHHKYCSSASRLYTDRHEWIVVDKEIGTVGISKYAQESLGDVVFAQLPEPNTMVTEGAECGALESVKAASEIYSPVTGKITEKNKEVEAKPGLINTNYYDKGWLFKVQLTKPDELKELMSEEQYQTFLKSDQEKADVEK